MTYRYAAFQHGRRVNGRQRAQNTAEALDILARRGLDVFNIDEQKRERFSFLKLLRAITGNELQSRLLFFRGYAALEAKGVPFEESFALLVQQIPPGRFSNAVQAVLQSLNEGERDSLSSAMSDHPDEFTHIECALVSAGERSRGRAEILERLAGFLERDVKLRKRLFGALTYPAIVVLFAVSLLLYIVFVLLPVFANLYTSFNVPAPPMMTAALTLGVMLRSPFWLGLFALMLAGVGYLISRWLNTPEGALRADKILLADGKIGPLRLWPFGVILRKTITSRTFRALSALLKSGVEIEQAIEIIAPVASNPTFVKGMQTARRDLSSGICSSLFEAFTKHKVFDSYALGFMGIGERVGQVPEMMMRLADHYDDDVSSLLQTLPEKIQVLVIIMLGFIITYLAYIVYVPIATLSTSIH